jgi:hypothetical protein
MITFKSDQKSSKRINLWLSFKNVIYSFIVFVGRLRFSFHNDGHNQQKPNLNSFCLPVASGSTGKKSFVAFSIKLFRAIITTVLL